MNLRPQFPLHPLCLAICLASPALHAQSGEPQKLDTVVVTGQGASLRNALDKQRKAQGVVSVVHADGIGQLPDNNAAEALARLPGLSVERDQGEGRFIRVRGLGPDLNAVTINGATLPAVEGDRRAVGLDVLPAGLVRALEVHKTLRPEMDANSLGGTVEVQTLSAFDQPGRLLLLEAGANHDANAGKTRPRAAIAFAARLADGRLGLALALSSDERRFASDNVETGGAWDGDKLEAFELRRYEILRERRAAALNLDFKPQAGSHYYLRALASQFDDTEQRQSAKFAFKSAQAEGGSADGSISRGLKAREERNRTAALSLGLAQQWGDWQAGLEASRSRASQDKPDGLASSAFKGSFQGLGFADIERPRPVTTAAIHEPVPYALDKLKLENGHASDRAGHLKADLQRNLDWGGWELALKGGLKLNRRDKDSENEVFSYAGKVLGKPPYNLGKEALSLASFLRSESVSYPWTAFGPGLSEAKLRSLVAPLPRAEFREAADSAFDDYAMQEDVDAGYLQAQLEAGAQQWLIGLRHERIDFEASGFALRDEQLQRTQAQTRSRHWLPAALWRLQLDGATALRAAWTNSVVRPSFGQLSPGLVSDGEEAELGNPLLKPLRSRNVDLGIEQGLGANGNAGAWSVYAFHKSIRDFVFQTDLAGSPGWQGYSAVHSFANGGAARVQGLELSWNQTLRQLPAPWNGLVLGANASLVRSRAEVGGYQDGSWQSRRIALPSQSDRTLNLSLGWENRDFSLRLALNHKSAYLLEVADLFDARKDQIVAAQQQVDLALRWNFRKAWQLGVEALNLANSPYAVHQRDSARNVQYERYGRAYKLGIKWAGF